MLPRFSALLLALVLTSCTTVAQNAPQNSAQARDLRAPLTAATQATLTPVEVIQLMKDGNDRFLSNTAVERNYLEQVRSTSTGQYPMAVVLGCIDSRVPHEIIFDKGVGDMFSARVAGNFVNTDILGSLEFATAAAGARLIIVLGHTECGAVKGACDHVELGNLTSTLANISPAVYSVQGFDGARTSANKEFVQAVAHENVDMTVQNIVNRSPIIRGLVAEGKVIVIGAMHDVATGRVTFDDASAVTAESLARR